MWLNGKEAACQCRRQMGLILGLGRSPAAGNDNWILYSCLENSTDSGARRATVHRVTGSDTAEQLRVCMSVLMQSPHMHTHDTAWHLHLTVVGRCWMQSSWPFNFVFLCISIISSFLLLTSSLLLSSPPSTISFSLPPMHHFSRTLYSSVALKSVDLINIAQEAHTREGLTLKMGLQRGAPHISRSCPGDALTPMWPPFMAFLSCSDSWVISTFTCTRRSFAFCCYFPPMGCGLVLLMEGWFYRTISCWTDPESLLW